MKPAKIRLFSAALSTLFFVENVCLLHASESSFWAERRNAAQKKPVVLAQAPSQNILRNLSVDPIRSVSFSFKSTSQVEERLVVAETTALAAPFAALQEAWISPNPQAPLVIQIQDIHAHEEAQKNIVGLIEALSEKGNVGLVGLEGAAGAFAIEPYRAYPNGQAKSLITTALMNQGYLSGPEAAAITMEKPPELWGVEDYDLYLRNVKAVTEGEKGRRGMEKFLSEAREFLDKEKRADYSPALKAFDASVEGYEDGRIGIGEHIRVLLKTWITSGGAAAEFAQLSLFESALTQEKQLSFERAQDERNALVSELTQKFSEADLSELVQKSSAVRSGALRIRDFYESLLALCERNRVSLGKFAHFVAYTRYVGISEKIQRRALLSELGELRKRLGAKLAKSDRERELLALSDDFHLITNLTRHEMTTDDWKTASSRWQLLSQWSNRAQKISRDAPALDSDALENGAAFCSIAVERNEALVKNLLGKMDQEKARTAVLVTGGFHTEGLTHWLKEKNVSTIVLTPKITRVPSSGSAYLDVFTRDPLPLEKAFAGERIFLASERLLSARAGQLASQSPGAKLRAQTLQGSFACAMPALALAFGEESQKSFEKLAERFPTIKKLVLVSADRRGSEVEFLARVTEKDGKTVSVRIVVCDHDDVDRMKHRNRKRQLLTQLDAGEGPVVLVFEEPSSLFARFLSPAAEPFLVLGLVVLARAFLNLSLFSPSDFSLSTMCAVHLIGATIAVAHALIRKDARASSFAQWFVAFSFFAGAFMFLSWQAGLLWNWVVHFPWNQIYWTLWSRGSPVADYLRPLSLGRDESPNVIEQKLTKVLSSKRGLVFTDNPDALYAALRQRVKGPTLRLCLQEQSVVLALSKLLHIDEAGGTHIDEEGPLIKMIKEGGTLFIDYSNSDPKIVEQFNSLFDKPAYYRRWLANPNLTIVGAIDPAAERRKKVEDRYPVSFYRRFKRKVRIHNIPDEDPLETRVKRGAALEGAVTLDMLENPNFQKKLVGRTFVRNRIQVQAGAFVEAIRAHNEALAKGQIPLPLVLRGAPWQNRWFTDFLRQAFETGSFLFNGEYVEVPRDLTIVRVDRNYSQGVEDKQIVGTQEADITRPAWTINSETMPLLFSRMEVIEAEEELGKRTGQLFEGPGLLEEGPLRLRITETLPDWVWNEIMHAPHPIQVEVLPGVVVPSIYRQFQATGSKQAFAKPALKTWDEAKEGKVVVVESKDLDFVQLKVEEETSSKSFVHNVTPDTTMDQLLSSIEIQTRAEGFGFSSEDQPLIQALRLGRSVILNGLESNEKLARQLETVLYDDPYLVVNNKRESLTALSGKLILTCRIPLYAFSNAQNRAQLELTDEELEKILARELKKEPEKFKEIMELLEIISKLPAAAHRHHELARQEEAHPIWRRLFPGLNVDERSRLYPSEPYLGLSRLRLLYKYDSLLEGFEDVFISSYADDPEVAAFLRTTARLVLDEEEPGRRANTIAGRKLFRILNKTMDPNEWQLYLWQLADTLSLAQLKQISISRDINNAPGAVRDLIKAALIDSNPDSRDDYRALFGEVTTNSNLTIDMETRIGELNTEELRKKAARLLKKGIPLMFRGAPGTGKSHLAGELKKNEFKEAHVEGPLTVGPDTKEQELWRRRQKNEQGRTEWMNERVANWADTAGSSLLIVDEANLAKPGLWNFLVGQISDEKAVVMTGNPRTLAGRNDVDFIREQAVTLHFDPFDQEFLQTYIESKLNGSLENPERLAKLLLGLHVRFEKQAEGKGLSLRDVQELLARVKRAGPDWTVKSVISIAWRQYRGLFNLTDRAALRFIIAKQFGVDLDELEKAEVEAAQAEADKFWDSDELVITPSIAKMVASIDDCLLMRADRMRHPGNRDGKRGMLSEGHSGRGKDLPIVATLKNRGFFDAKSAPPGTPTNRLYYHLNASLDAGEMIQTIRKAQNEGSIVILSEMNLLDTAFLEGKLNDVLTDIPESPEEEGFFLFATMNSADYAGRGRLSTALQNRMIISLEADYSEDELLTIAQTFNRRKNHSVPYADLVYLVKAHLWIASKIENGAFQPTTPDLIEALEVCAQGASMEEAIHEVYGLVFIENFLEGKETLPSRKTLSKFEPKQPVDNLVMLQRIYAGLMPAGTTPLTLLTDKKSKSSGYHSAGEGIALNPDVWKSEEGWQGTFFHESSHGVFTRRVSQLTPSSFEEINQLFQDLEDLRQLTAFDTFFPFAKMGRVLENERAFAKMIREGDISLFANWDEDYGQPLTPRKMFSYTLIVYAKGLLGNLEEATTHVRQMAEILDEISVEHNPLRAVLLHLAKGKEIIECVPKTLNEPEVMLAQIRMLRILHTMKDDYERLPKDFPQPKNKTDKQRVEDLVEEIRKKEMAPSPAKVQEEQPVVIAAPLTEAQVAKKKAALRRKHLHLPQFGMGNKNLLWNIGRKVLVGLIVIGIVSTVIFYTPSVDLPSAPGWGWRWSLPSSTSLLVWFIGVVVSILFSHLLARNRHIARLMAALSPRWLTRAIPHWLLMLLPKVFVEEIGALHNADDMDESEPIPLIKPKHAPRVEPAPRVDTRPGTWDDRMRAISSSGSDDLDQVLKEFVANQYKPGDAHGPTPGLPDWMQFFLEDQVNWFLGGMPSFNASRVDLVITGAINEDNPIFKELLRFLEVRGFTVHFAREPLSDQDKAELARGRLVRFIDAAEIQQKVDDIYLAGAYRAALEEQSQPPELSEGEQKKLVDEILERLGLAPNHFLDGYWALRLDNIDLAHVPELNRLTRLENIFLRGTSNVDLTMFAHFPRLKTLVVTGTSVNLEEVHRLFYLHPSRENLMVQIDSNRFVDYKDYLAWAKQNQDKIAEWAVEEIGRKMREPAPDTNAKAPTYEDYLRSQGRSSTTPELSFADQRMAEPVETSLWAKLKRWVIEMRARGRDLPPDPNRVLTFEEQINEARRFLEKYNGTTVEIDDQPRDKFKWGGDAPMLQVNYKSQKFAIVLHYGKSPVDLRYFSGFTRLALLDLQETNVSDLGGLETCLGLEALSIDRTPVDDLSPLRNLRNLRYLIMVGTHVASLEPLHGLALEGVDVTHANIEEWQILALFAHHPKPALLSVSTFYKRYTTDVVNAITAGKPAPATPASEDQEYTPVYQIEWAKDFLRRNGATEEELIPEHQREYHFFTAPMKTRRRIIVDPDTKNFALDLSGMTITLLGDSVRALTRLIALDISEARGIDTIEPFATLPNLRILKMDNFHGVKNFDPLRECHSLEHLSLNGTTDFSDVTLLYHLPLREVDLTGTGIQHVDVAKFFRQSITLENVWLSGRNRLRSYYFAPKILSFDEQINRVKDALKRVVGPLIVVTDVKEHKFEVGVGPFIQVDREREVFALNLDSLPMTIFDFLEGLHSLTALSMDNTRVKDLDFLEGMPNLKRFSAAYTRIASFDGLFHARNLRSVDMTDSGFDDFKRLQEVCPFLWTVVRVPPTAKPEPIAGSDTQRFIMDLRRSVINLIDANPKAYKRLMQEGYTAADLLIISGLIGESEPQNMGMGGVILSGLVVASLVFVVSALFFLPLVFMGGVFVHMWLIKALGWRAGPEVNYENQSEFLASAISSPSTFFFSVDPKTKTLLVNPNVKAALSRLPPWLQNVLLHGFGVVGHEELHRLGYGEVVSYGITQVIPALICPFFLNALISWAISKWAKRVRRSENHARLAATIDDYFPRVRSVELERNVDPKKLAQRLEEAKREQAIVSYSRELGKGRPVVMDLSDLFRYEPGSSAYENVKEHLMDLQEAVTRNYESKSQIVLLARGYDQVPREKKAVVEAFRLSLRQTKIDLHLVTNDPRIFEGGRVRIAGIRFVFFRGTPTLPFTIYTTNRRIFADLSEEELGVILLLMMPGRIVRATGLIEEEINRKVFLSVQA